MNTIKFPVNNNSNDSYSFIGGHLPKGGYKVDCIIYKNDEEVGRITFSSRDKRKTKTIDIFNAIVTTSGDVSAFSVEDITRHLDYIILMKEGTEAAYKMEESPIPMGWTSD